MKLLCTGDWHVHNFTDFSKTLTVDWCEETLRYTIVDEFQITEDTKEMNSRLYNILQGICDMRDYCLKNEIHHVLMAGDVFHKRASIEVTVFNATYKILSTFKEVGIEVHLLSGNHDQVDSSQIPTSAIHSFKEIVHVIEKPIKFDVPDGDHYTEVVAVPYSKDKQFILQSISDLRENCVDPDRAILLSHLGVTGGVTGSGMYVMSDEYSLGDLLYDKWKYVVLGHYHRPQCLSNNTFYCGTPVQNTFNDEILGENGYNGFYVVDTNKRYDIEFVPIIAPRFITVSSADELKKYDAEFLERNYIRVKANADEVENIKDALEDILGEDNTQEVRLELEKTYVKDARSDIGVAMSFAEAVKTYANERYDKDNKDAVVDMGLSILAEATTGGE